MPFRCTLDKTCGEARATTVVTDHGVVRTPVFMPVGTQAAVKSMSPKSLGEIQAQIILANAYHLFLRPGVETVEAAGRIHQFMGWDKPVLTDSGGYQVFSLADLRKVSDKGVTFRSHIDGEKHLFTPSVVIEAQARIGADIIMSLDYCTSYPCTETEAEEAVALTTRWAKKGANHYGTRFDHNGYEQVIFGIVQGSVYESLRRRSAQELTEIDFPGYALGGLSVGEEKQAMWEMVEVVTEQLPKDKPRYLMGVGTPEDLVDGVSRGIDMFDCVMPTRNARNGTVFTRQGKLVLKNSIYAKDFSPLDASCECYTCRTFTRAYLRHLFQAGEILAPVLATHHSLYFYLELTREMRRAVEDGSFFEWKSRFLDCYTSQVKTDRENC